eukprot:scaffold33704_cov41-Phaeocystis_antarctica.AAC.1
MPAYGSWRRSPQASEHGDGQKPTVRTAAAVKHLQPCTAHSGRNASVTKLATLASSEHGDGPSEPTTDGSGCSKALAQPCTAHSERARRRPIRADGKGSGCSKAPAALNRAKRWKRQRNEAGDARVERARRRPKADDEASGCSKALAALHRAKRWKRQRIEAGDARVKRARRRPTPLQSRRRRQRLQQSTCTALNRVKR